MSDLLLAVFDFKLVPHYKSADNYTIKKPFFNGFMAMMSKHSASGLTDPRAGVRICGKKIATTQIVKYGQERMSSK